MERFLDYVWRTFIIIFLFFICSVLFNIEDDIHATADSVATLEQDLADAQDRIDYLADEVDTVNSTVRALWTMPFCFSETEDSVMIGCTYKDGGWYRENNGDGFGVDAVA